MQDVAVDYLQSLVASMLIPFKIFCVSGLCTTFTSNTITYEIILPKNLAYFLLFQPTSISDTLFLYHVAPNSRPLSFVPGYQLYTTRFSHSLPGETTRTRTRVMAGAHGAGGVFGSV